MAVQNAQDVAAEYGRRLSWYAGDHAEMDKLVNAYYGILPPEFADYFDAEMHVHIINMLRMSWDDLAIRAGKVFRLKVQADNNSDTARARADKLVKIGMGYNEAGACIGGIGRDMVQKVQAWWMVGCANAVYLVLPDYEYQSPFITFRDPRTYYPPAGWSPYSQAPADDGIFAYQMTVGELRRRYPDAELEVSKANSRRSTGYGGSTGRNDDETQMWVAEYYSKDSWMVTTISDEAITLARSDNGDRGHPDVNPVVPVSLYNPSGAKGRSFLADQVSIQAALARMFSQKLDFYDRSLYPLIFHTPLMGRTIRVGPYATNQFDTTDGNPPRVEVVAPAHQIDADQTMQFALGLSRMLNRNPESFQGQGQADSAKAISALESGPTATIKDDLWPPMLAAEPRIMEVCARMDMNLWGNVQKNAQGRVDNRPYTVTYTPTVDLRNREKAFSAKGGYLAGYQGTLEILQELGAEQIDELSALEMRPDVDDADDMHRRIEMDRISKLERLQLATAAQLPPGSPGALQDGALAEIKQLIAKGRSWDEAITELRNQGKLTIAQPPPEAALPGAGGLPGQPGVPTGPGAGNAAAFLPLPTISALRGGPGGIGNGRPAPTA